MSRRQELNLRPPLYQSGALTTWATAGIHTGKYGSEYPGRDSNAHCPDPESGASCRLGYPGMGERGLCRI